jgi:hypothetical protein
VLISFRCSCNESVPTQEMLSELVARSGSICQIDLHPLHDPNLLLRQPIQLIHKLINLFIRRIDLALQEGFLVLGLGCPNRLAPTPWGDNLEPFNQVANFVRTVHRRVSR